ncbi:MAG: M67 family metallopeptidase [Cyanobacteria bacterium Co-bin13]|nr:M67 family metallopeptidase [Cyanobacteria bacterium Co-bin13]
MVLILDPENLQGIRAHAEQTYPEECCGLLVGQWLRQPDGDDTRQVLDCVAADNDWNETSAAEVGALRQQPETESTAAKTSRYWIDPKVLLRVQREARDRNLDIVGVYHSHPDHVAVPSECDRTLAWPGYSYIIVAVTQGKATDLRSWHLDEQHQFQPEVMRMGA